MIIIPSNTGLNLPKGSTRFPYGHYAYTPSTSEFTLNADFTIETWYYPITYPGMAVMLDFRADSGGYRIYPNGGNLTLNFGSSTYTTSGFTLTQNAWNHVAVTRSGSTLKAFISGREVLSVTKSTALTVANSGNVYISSYEGGTDTADSYMSNLRIVNGTAVYTSAFSPPTSPLTAISGTVLLTCHLPTVLSDGSPYARTFTKTISVAQSSTSPYA